jgi:hypothetical protein
MHIVQLSSQENLQLTTPRIFFYTDVNDLMDKRTKKDLENVAVLRSQQIRKRKASFAIRSLSHEYRDTTIQDLNMLQKWAVLILCYRLLLD